MRNKINYDTNHLPYNSVHTAFCALPQQLMKTKHGPAYISATVSVDGANKVIRSAEEQIAIMIEHLNVLSDFLE